MEGALVTACENYSNKWLRTGSIVNTNSMSYTSGTQIWKITIHHKDVCAVSDIQERTRIKLGYFIYMCLCEIQLF